MRGSAGYFVLVLRERRAEEAAPFERVRAQVRAEYLRSRGETALTRVPRRPARGRPRSASSIRSSRPREAARRSRSRCSRSRACASDAGAHARSTSTSSWDLEAGRLGARGGARALGGPPARAARARGSAAGGAGAARGPGRGPSTTTCPRHYRCPPAGEACAPSRRARAGAVARSQPRRPQLARSLSAPRRRCVLAIDGFLEAVPAHLHLARLRRPRKPVVERVFVSGSSAQALEPAAAAPAAAGSGFADYVRLGIEHIATGADHLVFLLALLLLGASFVEVATIVTGFTVAHSVTLALGVLGVVRPLSAAIEALIGLSIAIVALENFALTVGPRDAPRHRARAGRAACWPRPLAAALGALAVPASALLGVGLFALCSLGLLERAREPGAAALAGRLRLRADPRLRLRGGAGGDRAAAGAGRGRAARLQRRRGARSARDRRAGLAAAAVLLRREPAQRRRLIQLGSTPDPRRRSLLVPEPGARLMHAGERVARSPSARCALRCRACGRPRGRAARARPRSGRRPRARAARSSVTSISHQKKPWRADAQ